MMFDLDRYRENSRQLAERFGARWLAEADAGDPVAQCKVGMALRQAGHAWEAFPWLLLAADQGQSDALRIVGECLSNGTGARADIARGSDYMRRAAEAGDMRAKRTLAAQQPTP